MFGISPLGWLHTLGSLPAIPLAIYMLVRYGRITPRNVPGKAYFVFMVIGAISIFFIAHQTVSYGIAIATIIFLVTGYGITYFAAIGRAAIYIETLFLSITVFLLMVPSVSETLRRVPDSHPFITDPKSPLLLGVLSALLIILVVGIVSQIVYLRKRGNVWPIT